MPGINDTKAEKGFLIYPNPSKGHVTLQLTEEIKGPVTVKILEITGRELRKFNISQKVTKLSLTDIPKGIYLLTIETNDDVFLKELFLY